MECVSLPSSFEIKQSNFNYTIFENRLNKRREEKHERTSLL